MKKVLILTIMISFIIIVGCERAERENYSDVDNSESVINASTDNAGSYDGTSKGHKNEDEYESKKCIIDKGNFEHYTVGIITDIDGEREIRCIENVNLNYNELYITGISVPEYMNTGEVVVLYYDGMIKWLYNDEPKNDECVLYGSVDNWDLQPLEGCVLDAVILDSSNTCVVDYESPADVTDGGPADSYLMSLEGRESGRTAFIEVYIDRADTSSNYELPFIGDEVEIEFDRNTLEVVSYRKKQ